MLVDADGSVSVDNVVLVAGQQIGAAQEAAPIQRVAHRASRRVQEDWRERLAPGPSVGDKGAVAGPVWGEAAQLTTCGKGGKSAGPPRP